MGVHIVYVGGRPHDVSTYQRRKTVWVASGEYDGERLIQEGRSETSALRAWEDIADYRMKK
ncbi:hypothetical protein [Sphingopyxis sp. YF1]|uniref:hypothetical protein n=1 Tax=Sphingopyxis sp. YF1 TaxID=2482763 RepID=UPI001F612196|nr:hypothetical protein [Sphingopyxis sp. YF1]